MRALVYTIAAAAVSVALIVLMLVVYAVPNLGF